MIGRLGRALRISYLVVTALAAVPLAAVPIAGTAAADPHADYMLHCQGCHGPTGSGVPGNVPSFRDFVARFVSVEGGREYLLRVPGSSQSELNDARTAQLINWILREFDREHLPASFVPFDEEEVRRWRRPPLVDVSPVRARLVGLMGLTAEK